MALEPGMAINFTVTFVAISVLVCRLAKMSSETLRAVRYQHAALCSALLISLVVPADWSATVSSFGVLVYFLFSTHRWRHGAPEATTGPVPLDEAAWPFISGGTDEKP